MTTPFDAGREQQQHRLEKLVKNHLVEIISVPDDYCKTELERTMQSIIRQFIDAVKSESASLKNFESIYLSK